jgi:hypothetical protein
LGEDVAGPNLGELVDLVEQIIVAARKPIPAVHSSLADFVPTHLRDAFDAETQECRGALRSLIREAKAANQLSKRSPELAAAEVNPFYCALMRLCNLPINGVAVEEVVGAIQLLASLDVVLLDEEKRGPPPIYNLCRASARAAYYYRARHALPLSVNFEYLDRTGAKPGTRYRKGDLEPVSPTAALACEVVTAFGIAGDASEVQTHLRNYKRQLEDEARQPLRSDFLFDLD